MVKGKRRNMRKVRSNVSFVKSLDIMLMGVGMVKARRYKRMEKKLIMHMIVYTLFELLCVH